MFVVILVFELHIPHSRSLKEKRKVVRSLVERLGQRFNVSVTEVGWHDLHQRSRIGLAAVRQTPTEAEELVARIRRVVDLQDRALVTSWQPEIAKAEA